MAKTASGERWQKYVGKGIACPPEWGFGTKVKAFKKVWVCVDRGGMIKYQDGIPWVDFLEEKARLPYGKKHIVMIKEK